MRSRGGRRGDGEPPPLKRLGQHFLEDPVILNRIVDAANVEAGDRVLEIGAGRGSLTDVLLERGARVVAVEVDRMLAERLRDRYADNAAVTVVEGDALRMDLQGLCAGEYRVVANLPYYITTPLIFRLLLPPMPQLAVLLVQKEVAHRAQSGPGSKEYGALSVTLQSAAQVEVVFDVPAAAFRPPPKVDSAVLRITPLPRPRIPPERAIAFRRFVQSVFARRRKQIHNILRSAAGLSAADAGALLDELGIAHSARPETLTVEQLSMLQLLVAGKRVDEG